MINFVHSELILTLVCGVLCTSLWAEQKRVVGSLLEKLIVPAHVQVLSVDMTLVQIKHLSSEDVVTHACVDRYKASFIFGFVCELYHDPDICRCKGLGHRLVKVLPSKYLGRVDCVEGPGS